MKTKGKEKKKEEEKGKERKAGQSQNFVINFFYSETSRNNNKQIFCISF
jgi:hypothetical protein